VVPRAQGIARSCHRIRLYREIKARNPDESQTRTPTAAEMIPQTRYYVSRRVIFDRFSEKKLSWEVFLRSIPFSTWKRHGADFFRNEVWVAGSTHGESGYPMKEVAALCSYLLSSDRIEATRSAFLCHVCHEEFARQEAQRRPTALVLAHPSYKNVTRQ